MDKIVKHRFWILLALVPPLVIFGYYNANSAINAATQSAVSGLETAFNGIPPGNGPNPTWVKAADGGIEIYNQLIEKAVTAEKVRVWTDQLPRMTFPVKMEPFVPRTPAGMLSYRAELPREAGFTYKAGYTDQLEALYQSIEPLKQEKDGGVSGKVHLNRSAIPRHTFGDMLISSEAIWDAQEDLWLLQLLFDSIRGVNRPAENAAKSAVRRLSVIRLMGGDGNSTVKSMGAAGGGAMAGDGRGGGGDEDFIGIINSPRGGGGGAMGGMGQTNVMFDPSEEFGIGFEGMAGGGAVGAGDEDIIGTATGGRMNDMAARGAMGGMGAGQKEIRYIKFDAGAAFRERGFYMSVLIDQKKIADFLVELSNADWPIRIVRFNVGPNGGPGAGSTGYSAPSRFSMGGEREDTDDLSSMMGGGNAMFSGAGFGGGAIGSPDDLGFGGDDLFNAPLLGGGTGDEADPVAMGRTGGMIGAAPMVRGDQIGGLFLHPDLVQLDLCGVITMYNPPTPELLAAATAAPAGAGAVEPAASATAAEADASTAVETIGDPATADPAAETPAGDATIGAPPVDASATPEGAIVPEAAPASDAAPPTDTSASPPDAAATEPAPETAAPGT